MSMMGFKKIDALPEQRHCGVYDEMLETVAKSTDIYALDVHDVKRCRSLCLTLRNRIKRLGLPCKVIVRNTTVCVVRDASKPMPID